jgi:hypothetical protein
MANDADKYSDKETERRMEDAIRRAQKTPHKPHAKLAAKPAPKGKRKVATKA